MRAFYAVGLWDLLDISELHQDFHWSQEVRWVRQPHVHLTLNFLGEITPAEVSSASALLQETAATVSAFHLEWSRTGVFPNWHQPRVLWVGLKPASERIVIQLSKALGNHQPKPHVTMGRLPKGGSPELLDQWRNYKITWPSIPVTKLLLVKSTQTREGPIYEVVEEASLGK